MNDKEIIRIFYNEMIEEYLRINKYVNFEERKKLKSILEDTQNKIKVEEQKRNELLREKDRIFCKINNSNNFSKLADKKIEIATRIIAILTRKSKKIHEQEKKMHIFSLDISKWRLNLLKRQKLNAENQEIVFRILELRNLIQNLQNDKNNRKHLFALKSNLGLVEKDLNIVSKKIEDLREKYSLFYDIYRLQDKSVKIINYLILIGNMYPELKNKKINHLFSNKKIIMEFTLKDLIFDMLDQLDNYNKSDLTSYIYALANILKLNEEEQARIDEIVGKCNIEDLGYQKVLK